MPSTTALIRRWRELGFAALMPFVALALQSYLWESVRPLAFVLFYPALVLSSWVGGRVGGMVALCLSIGLASWFFIAPQGSFRVDHIHDIARILTFLAIGLFIVEAHHRFQLRSEQHRNITENMEDVVWVLDAETLRPLYVSRSVFKQRGHTVSEIMSQSPDAALSPALAARLRSVFADAKDRGTVIAEELIQTRKDGSTLWVEVIISRVANPRTGGDEIHCLSRNISARKRAEQRLRHIAQHDALTDLPNRVLFDEHVGVALAAARRDPTRAGLMFIDLDAFKRVNDTWGHRIGDLLLRAVSQRLRESVRESDIPARIGGDEFVVLLRNVQLPQHAALVGEKVRARLSEPFEIENHRFSISASIGIALYPEHGIDAIELARSADAAMYQAKEAGRNTVVLLDRRPPAS